MRVAAIVLGFVGVIASLVGALACLRMLSTTGDPLWLIAAALLWGTVKVSYNDE